MGRPRKQSSNGATLGFEATLWAAADKLRGHMDAAEYKHVVLGLIFPRPARARTQYAPSVNVAALHKYDPARP